MRLRERIEQGSLAVHDVVLCSTIGRERLPRASRVLEVMRGAFVPDYLDVAWRRARFAQNVRTDGGRHFAVNRYGEPLHELQSA